MDKVVARCVQYSRKIRIYARFAVTISISIDGCWWCKRCTIWREHFFEEKNRYEGQWAPIHRQASL